MSTLELAGVQGAVLIATVAYAFIAGAAFAAGAWTVLRVLNRAPGPGPGVEVGLRWLVPALVVVAVGLAAAFAWAASAPLPSGIPESQRVPFVTVQFIPFLVLTFVTLAGVWLVRKALR